ncbi:MAG: nucleotide sugar dehydrogenase [Blastocatellia bacterium]|nr:nucleotide sugar dehydrogenase [Blastocatellia bacterium]
MSYKVAVIGAAGHVGLPLALVLADHGNDVEGIDINEASVREVNGGHMPFYEEGADTLLEKCLTSGNFRMTTDLSRAGEADVIIIILGTPVDENFNPILSGLVQLIDNMCPFLREGQQIVLRSTVSPGTTDRVKKAIEKKTGMVEGKDFSLVYAPERVLQGKAISEIKHLPHIVGAYSEESFERIGGLFETFSGTRRHYMKPIEAEIGKLITNMSRYVNFALANEFHMIAGLHGANINKIIDACNDDYPRLNLPGPGPNVGGPCLFKDGWFLIEKVPFNDLIVTSFRINEGMPAQIAAKLDEEEHIESVVILGMAFKANSDDTRNSVSFKLKKQLEFRGYDVRCVDPHVPGCDDWSALEGADALVLMTPHKEFADLGEIMRRVGNPESLIVDIWGFWDEMRYRSNNGYFSYKEAASHVYEEEAVRFSYEEAM